MALAAALSMSALSMCALGMSALCMSAMATPAVAQDDVLPKAIRYLFTGTIDPETAPVIADLASCTVIVTDPQYNRSIRYHLNRFRPDRSRFESSYAGRTANYVLFVEGDDDVVEFLNPDMTVAHSHRTARIALAGELDQTERALQVISEQCRPKKPKPLF